MKKTLSTCIISLVFLISTPILKAQNFDDVEFLKQRDFGKYFISDMFSPNTASTMGACLLRSEYNINPDRNSSYAIMLESYIGTELPILRWDISGRNPSRLSISMPVCTNLLLDIFEPITHPVINTEYRIGALEINYLYEFSLGFLKNASIKFIPYFHESSHIGDEITIYRKDAGFPITRVNATSNTAEFSITLNDENGLQDNNHSLKIGTRFLYFPDYGFYRIRPEEGDQSKITPSKNRFEWYGQYQWHSPSRIIPNPKISTVFSIEIRNRVRYNYPYYAYHPESEQEFSEFNPSKKYVPSLNCFLGWRYRLMEEKASYLGLYFRIYLGVNPYGQFRNIPEHRTYGLSLVYEN